MLGAQELLVHPYCGMALRCILFFSLPWRLSRKGISVKTMLELFSYRSRSAFLRLDKLHNKGVRAIGPHGIYVTTVSSGLFGGFANILALVGFFPFSYPLSNGFWEMCSRLNVY